jgi:tetratricopeptide (TPR) repeat protein
VADIPPPRVEHLTMRPHLTIVLLLVACFTVATSYDRSVKRDLTDDATGGLAQFTRQGRKLFANQFFIRSDVYFHSGYYPGIFDRKEMKENHLAERAGSQEAKHDEHEDEHHVHGPNCKHDEDEHDFLGKPTDVMDAFSRHFIVSHHTHLTEKGTNAAREILPWLKLAAKMDPNKIESYTVAAYWLRDLGKKEEAETFLREGLRRNPHSFELLLELGRCYFERNDLERARNVWEMAMHHWRQQENPKPVEQQNRFVAGQILNSLARVEARLGNREKAAEWLGIVKKVSPHPEEIERIAEVRAGELLEPK